LQGVNADEGGGGEGGDAAWFVISPPVSHGGVTVAIDFRDADIQGWSLGLCHEPPAARLLRFDWSEELATLNFGEEPGFYKCEEAVEPLGGLGGSGTPRVGIVQAVVLSFYQELVLPAVEGGFPVLEVEYEVLDESEIGICSGLQGSGQPIASVLTVHGASFVPSEFPTATLAPKPYAEKLTYRVEPPESNEVVTVVLESGEIAVEGWSFALCNTALAAEVLEVATSPEVEHLLNGDPPEFVDVRVSPADPFVAVEQSIVLGTAPEPVAAGPFPEGIPLMGIRYRVIEEDELKFCDQVGGIYFDNRVKVEGVGYIPETRLGGRLVLGSLGARFIRGDADLNGELDLTDAVFVLMRLFLGGEALPCLDAADANDVGRVDISDPIFLLRFLFLGGPPPPPPFPEPGEDLSPQTALGCERGL
jgi:hypothetical protein